MCDGRENVGNEHLQQQQVLRKTQEQAVCTGFDFCCPQPERSAEQVEESLEYVRLVALTYFEEDCLMLVLFH